MSHEIETKVLDINKDEVERKLIALGAKETRDTLLIVDWYRPKGTKEGDDPWYLRIRSDSNGKSEVTWKAKSEIIGNVRKHKEINFIIEDKEKLSDLFLELGLDVYAHQEKKRKSFIYKDWVFEIDDYPKMPAFLEIEGDSKEHINEAMKLLSIENNRTWTDGEKSLIKKIYKLNWHDMKFE